MASTINEIIKQSLERLRREQLSLTPDNYSKIFCQVAKEKKVVLEDCQKVQKNLERLDNSFQQEAKRHKISDIDDLLNFFVAIVNRSNTAGSQKAIQGFSLLCKRLLQAISILHNKKAAALANASVERLDSSTQTNTVELIREKWLEFITNYDDEFLKKLDGFGTIRKDDLETLTNDVYKILNDGDSSGIYEKLAPLIIATLTPSIASSINDELASISYDLRNKPELLSSPAVQQDIRDFIKKRIELDKKEVNEKVATLNELLDGINQKILTLVGTSETHSKEVGKIKQDLQSIDITKDSFEVIQNKLMNIATSIETETKSLTDHMRTDKQTIDKLQRKISKLESALITAKKESQEDFLTNVATKRALVSELGRANDSYVRYQIGFSVCFIDIDHFKMINDTYGHEAGDVILATLGKILKRYARKVDFVGRYGGEEFLVILPNTNLANSIRFADKIRQIIENFKFIYKKERINVTISGGVAERKDYKSLDELVEAADKHLYNSKENGRNQVSPKK